MSENSKIYAIVDNKERLEKKRKFLDFLKEEINLSGDENSIDLSLRDQYFVKEPWIENGEILIPWPANEYTNFWDVLPLNRIQEILESLRENGYSEMIDDIYYLEYIRGPRDDPNNEPRQDADSLIVKEFGISPLNIYYESDGPRINKDLFEDCSQYDIIRGITLALEDAVKFVPSKLFEKIENDLFQMEGFYGSSWMYFERIWKNLFGEYSEYSISSSNRKRSFAKYANSLFRLKLEDVIENAIKFRRNVHVLYFYGPFRHVRTTNMTKEDAVNDFTKFVNIEWKGKSVLLIGDEQDLIDSLEYLRSRDVLFSILDVNEITSSGLFNIVSGYMHPEDPRKMGKLSNETYKFHIPKDEKSLDLTSIPPPVFTLNLPPPPVFTLNLSQPVLNLPPPPVFTLNIPPPTFNPKF